MQDTLKKHPWHIPVIFAITFIIHHMDRNVMAYALPQIAQEHGWTDRQTGEWGQYLIGAFFLTFGLAQVLLSGLAERFGAKRSIMAAIFGFSMISMLVGPLGGSLAALICLRLALGLAESVHIPMMGVITARLFPTDVRATANSIWSVGLIAATVLSSLVMVPLIGAVGWRDSFVVVGATGMLVGLPLVYFFVQEGAPAKSSPAAAQATASAGRSFMKTGHYWLYVLVGILNAFAGLGILSWLPTYFVRAKGVDFSALGWPLSIVFTTGIVGTLLFARLGDHFKCRALLGALGLVAAGLFVFFARSAANLHSLVFLFAGAMAGLSAYAAQEYSTVQQLVGDANVGSATGIYNGTGLVIGGVVGSMIPGAIVAATGSFDMALLALAAAACAGGVAMSFLRGRIDGAAAPGAMAAAGLPRH